MTAPIPTPAPIHAPREPFAVQAAKFSLYVPIVLMILNCVLTGTMNASHTTVPGAEQNGQRMANIVIAVFGFVGVTAGFLLGIIALFGIPRYGAPRILWRAVTGICLNVLFLASAIFLFFFLGHLTRHPVDKSLTTAEYALHGVPSPDEPWTVDDYTRAINALHALSTDDFNTLPRTSNPRSGALFARMVDANNFTFNAPPSALLRLQAEAKFGAITVPLSNLYFDAARRGALYPSEIVELSRWGLQLAQAVDHDMTAVLDSIPPADPRHALVAQQCNKARSEFAGSIDAAVDLLADTKHFSPDDISRLAGYEEQYLIPLLQTQPPQVTRAAADKVATARDAATDPTTKSALAHLHTAMTIPQP